jgi:coenzyme PQQ biosynthesis protein PqqD
MRFSNDMDLKTPQPNEQQHGAPIGRPALAPHVRLQIDQATGNPVLLFPEGIVVLNDTAKEIVSQCNGERTVSEIACLLAREYELTPDGLLEDVSGCIRDLERRRLIVLQR